MFAPSKCTAKVRVLCLSVLLGLAAATAAGSAVAAPLAPATHADFRYYTFALTWQPGICGTDEGCLADQPKTDLIGLHGLWASLPQTLVDRGVAPQQWWQRGCDYFEHTDAAPPLDGALAQRLGRVMPHFTQDLLTHEYDKHVACFGFDPTQFFTTELAMHDAVVASSFGRYLLQREGAQLSHPAVVAAFAAAFATDAAASLQLRCGHDATGRTVLTQFWITIAADRLSAFPQPGSLIDAPIAQDDCPAAFVLPAWPDSSASSGSEPKPSPGF
jgi:ribonuclease I (enterobacter ribonuclease)